MERVVLPEVSRNALARSAMSGSTNTWVVEGGHALAQRTPDGIREFRLESGESFPALSGMAEREVRYDRRSGRYAVMVGGKVRYADLAESVTAPSKRILRRDGGVATLSGQSVVVGPPESRPPSFRRK